MFCIKCGKEMPEGALFCPSCGESQQPTSNGDVNTNCCIPAYQQPIQKDNYDATCIVGLVISGLSLFVNFWGIVGLAGTIVSIIGLTNSKKKNQNGKTLAIAGIAIGAFSVIYGILSLIFPAIR